MRAKSNSKKNSSSTVKITKAWRVAHVEALANYQLRVEFVDKTSGMVDLSNLINGKQAGVFAILADPNLFKQAYVKLGVVTWPTDTEFELDLAPDAMYLAIKETGSWIL